MSSLGESRTPKKDRLFGAYLILPLLLGGLFVIADYYAVSANGSMEVLLLRDLLLLGAYPLFYGVLIALGFAIFSKSRRKALKYLILCAAFVAAVLLGFRIGSLVRTAAFAGLAERARPLINAIECYQEDFGSPPPNLSALVPEHLSEIPHTGMGAYPEFRYTVKSVIFDGNAWELSVRTPTSFLNFDEFLYYPLQNYPACQCGNRYERIRDWAYKHE